MILTLYVPTVISSDCVIQRVPELNLIDDTADFLVKNMTKSLKSPFFKMQGVKLKKFLSILKTIQVIAMTHIVISFLLPNYKYIFSLC